MYFTDFHKTLTSNLYFVKQKSILATEIECNVYIMLRDVCPTFLLFGPNKLGGNLLKTDPISRSLHAIRKQKYTNNTTF